MTDEKTTKEQIINHVVETVGASESDILSVMYGEGKLSNEKLRLPIMIALTESNTGIVICAVWKGKPIPSVIRNMPRYDYYGQIIEGLNLQLHKNGYTSQVLVNHDDLADYTYYEQILTHPYPVGLVSVASHRVDVVQQVCKDYNRPIVFLDYPAGVDQAEQYIITFDSEKFIRELIAHLYGLGHRRIAFIKGPQDKETAVERYRGYIQGLEEFGLAFDESLVASGNWLIASGVVAAKKLLDSSCPPTAIVCSNDLMALGALEAIQAMGLKVPDDISLVGFDDTANASFCNPPLTTVRTSMTEMGSKAGEYIVKLLEGESPMPYSVNFPLEVIYRESTAAPSSR